MSRTLFIFLGMMLLAGFSNSQTRYRSAKSNSDQDGVPSGAQKDSQSEKPATYDKFDWDLFKLMSNQKKENILLSPLSLKMAMVILYEAAAGHTKSELKSVMSFDQSEKEVRKKFLKIRDTLKTPPNNEYTLDLGSRIYLDRSILPEQMFASLMQDKYNTDIVHIDVTAPSKTANDANKWVKELTKGNIKEIVDEKDLQDAVILLLTTVYFNGTWLYQFQTNNTKNAPFYLSATKAVNTPMMTQEDRFMYADSKPLEAKLLRMPYKSQNISMIIALPNSIQGLGEMVKLMAPSVLARELDNMDYANVKVTIPKFKFDFESHLISLLKDMGLTEIFQNTASFPRLARGQGLTVKLSVSKILQKAGIEVNEVGSTAYASTAITLVNKFGEDDNNVEEFIANKPFMFFIQDDQSKQILFMGTMDDPLQSEGKLEEVKEEEDMPDNLEQVYTQSIRTTTAQPQQYPTRGNFLNPPTVQQNKPMLPTHYSFFDLELLKYTAQQTTGNFMVSPASIKAAMGMLLEGAMGKCADELRFTLRLPNNQQQIREYFFTFLRSLNISSEGILLETANKVFLNNRYTPDESYQKSLTDYYFANLHQVDFANTVQTVGIINGWVNFATRGLIPTVVNNGDFDPETVMILANVLYFKGAWETAFESRFTQNKCFKYQQKCRNVAMMEIENDFKYGVIDELRSQAVELPYKGGKYSMLILLPKEEDGLARLENDISFVSIPNILKQMETNEVELSLPKFTIDFSQDLVEILRKTGINEVFAPSANLSGMVLSNNPSPQVNNVFHKTRIEVNEQGSEAAAITGAMVIPLMGSSASRMNVNHPFLFFIRDVTTGTILFEGRVNIPDEVPVQAPAPQRPAPVQRPAQPQSRPGSSFVNSNDNSRYTTYRPRTAFDPVNPNTNNEQTSYNSQSNNRNQPNNNYQTVREKPTYQPSNTRTQSSNTDDQPFANRNQPNRYNQGLQPQQDTRNDYSYVSQQVAPANEGQGSNRNTQVNQLSSQQSTAIRFEENSKNENYNAYQGDPISGKQLSAPSQISFARSVSSSPSASKHDASYNTISSTPSPAYSSSKINTVNRFIPPVVITLIPSQFSNDRYNLQRETSIGNGPQENEALLTNNNLQTLSKPMEVVYQKPLSKDKDAIAFAL